jgi:hypothetical protein
MAGSVVPPFFFTVMGLGRKLLVCGKDLVGSNLGFQLIFGLHMVGIGNISNTILSGSREKCMGVFLDSFQDIHTWGNVTNIELDLVDLFRGCLLGLGKR